MTETAVRVEARLAGKRAVEGWLLPLPATEELPLRDLIRRVVGEEVQAFRERQAARSVTRVMSRVELAAAVERGKIDPGGERAPARIDEDEEVARALLGFHDGLYHVFIDDRQVTDLDEIVRLVPGGRVLFLRLVALAGG